MKQLIFPCHPCIIVHFLYVEYNKKWWIACPEGQCLYWVPQAARKIKKAKSGVIKEAQSIKTAKNRLHSTKTGKMWIQIGVN